MKKKKTEVMIIAANNVWMLPKQRKRNQKNEKKTRGPCRCFLSTHMRNKIVVDDSYTLDYKKEELVIHPYVIVRRSTTW